jgi:nucleoside-diphosphate-sugar epimerase
MVIGNGLMGRTFSSFTEYDEVVIFASGVSNSKEQNDYEFEKETTLLNDTISKNKNKKLIYFSTVFIDNIKSKYYTHKKNMETIIVEKCQNYLIVRLPQVVGYCGNSNNLFNFLKNKINCGDEIQIDKSAIRSLIDVDDVYKIVTNIIPKYSNQILNLKGIEDVYVSDIVEEMYNTIGVKKNVQYINNITKPNPIKNSDLIDIIIKELYINEEGYTKKLIKKYCTI